MNKIQLTGAALAVGAAAMFALAPAFADETTTTTTTASVHCAGIGTNACKGQGSCKTADNACKGKNSCKGKGIVDKATAEECTKAGGTVVAE